MSTVSVGVLESNFSQPGAAIQETLVQVEQAELGSSRSESKAIYSITVTL